MTPSQGLISAGSMFEGAHVCESAWSDFLYDLVSSHARYMAEHQKQGHQYFEQRFLIVRKELGLKATEICAESWEWQTILPYDQLGWHKNHSCQIVPYAALRHLVYGENYKDVIQNHKDEYDFSLVDINRMEFKPIDLELGLDNFAKLWLDDDSLNIIAKEYAKLVNINEEKSINILKNCDIKLKSFVEFKRKIRGKK